MLRQETLADYYRLTNELSDLQRKVRKLESERSGLKETILREIVGKRRKEPGPYTVFILDGPRHVSWKDVFISRCGEGAAQKVLDETEPSVRLKVIVDTEK